MVNINNKPWDKIRFADIEKLLSGNDDENFFFEFKSDNESPAKLVKEVSAFANTYGGYILLGVNDNKTISGCTHWTEQRIHTTIHDSLTPIPNFAVKNIRSPFGTILVIKVEEGTMPPYITNKGQIFQRVSSGSFPITDAAKLSQLYQKRADQLMIIKNKIELPELTLGAETPHNIFAYVDFGFATVCSAHTKLQRNFFKMDLTPVTAHIKKLSPDFSVSQVGYSYIFTFGEMVARDNRGNIMPLGAGIHNFLEIMPDGSIRGRIVLTGKNDSNEVDITAISYFIHGVFREIFEIMLGKDFSKIFVCAHKYEKLTVFKQFVPVHLLGSSDTPQDKARYKKHLDDHQNRYGNNLIVVGNRVPRNDYSLCDRRLFSECKVRFNTENLLNELFYSRYSDLGYIDDVDKLNS